MAATTVMARAASLLQLILLTSSLRAHADEGLGLCPGHLFPVPQACSATGQSFSLWHAKPAWRIAANLSDADDNFAASWLQKNLSSFSVTLSVVDIGAVTKSTLNVIVLGRGARGGHTETYTLHATSHKVTLSGSDPAGTFYAAVTFAQLCMGSNAKKIPELRLTDYPDLPLRGFEVESKYSTHMSEFTWAREVADVMASYKMNWVLLDWPSPMYYKNYSTWVDPSPTWVTQMRGVLAYFKQRHIDVALVSGSRWDPRTLEGKFVKDEPFTLGADDVARAVRPKDMHEPVNGGFEVLGPDGKTPVGWTFQKGSNSDEVPCSLDSTHAATGKHSVRCDVQHYPDPKPGSASTSLGRRAPLKANPMTANYSGPLTSDIFAVEPGSMVEMRFKASWAGNWTGDFVATVSIYQYETAAEAKADEDPTTPKWPFTLNFLPCLNGDHGHCDGRAIPVLPAWTDFTKAFITMPTAKFLRVRVYVANRGAGQWWVDDFSMTRIDAMLKNVVRLGDTDVVVKDAATGATMHLGSDYTIQDPPTWPTRIDPFANFSRLEPLVIRRVPTGRLPPRANLTLSYNVLPGSANQMMGSRDVQCYADPHYYALAAHAIEWTVRELEPPYLVADGFDEQMGMGRDSRTLATGLTNGEILGHAISKLHDMVSNARNSQGHPARTKMVMWADLLVPDHNGGADYSWSGGAGRRQPYWPAIKAIAGKNILQLSWEYDTSYYSQKMIRDDPELFHNYSLPWVGSGWTTAANVKLWADALRVSRARYGASSTAQGLICTNWGGGRIESGVPFVAGSAWNLAASP